MHILYIHHDAFIYTNIEIVNKYNTCIDRRVTFMHFLWKIHVFEPKPKRHYASSLKY